MSLLIRDAHIHSPLDPFATALHIESGVITWLGDEDTARYRGTAHPDVTELDAGGRLIAPAFVDALTPTGQADLLLAHGVTAAHTSDTTSVRDDGGLDLTFLRRAGTPRGPDQAGPGVLVLGPATAEQVGRFLSGQEAEAAARAGELLGLTVTTAEDARAVVAGITRAPGELPIGAPHRIHVDAAVDLPEELFALAERRGIPLIVTRVWEAAAADGIRIPLASLARRGIPFALASGGGDPWRTLAAAATTGPAPLTARAAFNAHVRGAWRVTPGPHLGRGVLRVGAPADLAIWETDTLIVQTPDERIAAWSTDARAGTPLLPLLGASEPAPNLWRVVHAGNVLR